MNKKIDLEIQKIKMLKQVMSRTVEYNKNIKRQVQFNNDLANDHKQKT